MALVEGPRCIAGEVAFVVFEPQIERLVECLTQTVHQLQILVTGLALARFQPLDAIAANPFLHLLRAPAPNAGGIEFAILCTRATLDGQFAGQNFWGEQRPLRPALAGKVVDKAGNEVVQAGFGHGGDCISGMS